jgi:hypothetical protein
VSVICFHLRIHNPRRLSAWALSKLLAIENSLINKAQILCKTLEFRKLHTTFKRTEKVKHLQVFWVVTMCSVVVEYQRFRGSYCLHLLGEDGSSVVHRNVGILPRRYTASQPRRPGHESSLSCKPQVSHSQEYVELFKTMFFSLKNRSKAVQ